MSAACASVPTAVFFDDARVAQAKAVCASCPVIEQCRANHHAEEHGVWFGTTPRERGRRRCGTAKPTAPTALDAVAAVLSGSPSRRFTGAQVADWLAGQHSRDAVHVALRRLLDRGKVDRFAQSPGRPSLYRWADQVPRGARSDRDPRSNGGHRVASKTGLVWECLDCGLTRSGAQRVEFYENPCPERRKVAA